MILLHDIDHEINSLILADYFHRIHLHFAHIYSLLYFVSSPCSLFFLRRSSLTKVDCIQLVWRLRPLHNLLHSLTETHLRIFNTCFVVVFRYVTHSTNPSQLSLISLLLPPSKLPVFRVNLTFCFIIIFSGFFCDYSSIFCYPSSSLMRLQQNDTFREKHFKTFENNIDTDHDHEYDVDEYLCYDLRVLWECFPCC